jgi:hypothetical protein
LSIVTRGALYNMFHLLRPYPHTLAATASGFSLLILFFITRHEALRHAASSHTATLTHFVCAIIAILLVQVLTAEWWPITALIQLQLIRAGVLALVFGNLYLAWYVGLMALAVITAPVEFIVLLARMIQQWIKPHRLRRGLSVLATVGLGVSTYAMALQLQAWSPGIHIFAEDTPYNQAQRWAKDHTPLEAVFIVPPERWWIYESAWRVFSQRSTTPQLADLLIIAFVPEYLPVWERGYEQVAPDAAAQFNGDWRTNWDIGARAFYGLSDTALLTIARDWQASYLVVESAKSPLRPWPVVYENQQYQIYQLPLTH